MEEANLSEEITRMCLREVNQNIIKKVTEGKEELRRVEARK